MNLWKDDAGFSLIELIVVMTIMAVLVGVLAPQFLKYVNNARVATDIDNAQELARLVDAAIADTNGNSVAPLIQGAGGTAVTDVPGLDQLPVCKRDASFVWKIDSSQGTGVTSITLNGYEIYPYVYAANSYYAQYYKK